MKRKSKKPRSPAGYVAVIDLGSTKVACFIGAVDAGGNVNVIGIGHQLSKGIRCGVIADVADAQAAVVSAVHAAEQMAGHTLDEVVVNVSGAALNSRSVAVEMALMGEAVSERDMLDILQQGRGSALSADQEILHCFPVSYALDEMRHIRDPRQMFGARLSADLHIISAPMNQLRNLSHCLARCHLDISEYVASPYASALSVLDEDEMQLGVTLIDMGGGTTSIAIFSGGRNVYNQVIPLGGAHVTNDVARGLSTTITQAERLKTLHGSVLPSPQDDQVMIDAPQLGEAQEGDENSVFPRSMLVGIIRPRMEEIFEMVRSALELSGMGSQAGRRVVLTGGASQLLGVREMAATMLGKQVRLGKPRASPGLAEAVSGPAFACGLGMLEAVTKRPLEERLFDTSTQSRGKFTGMLGWIKENF